MKASPSIAEMFEPIVSSGHVRAATEQDIVAGVQPEYVVSPGSEQELAAVLACANEAGIAVIPRGGGTKLDWGNPPARTGIILSTLRLNRVVEHAWADLTVVVEAGCTMQALQSTLAQHGQRLAVDALWQESATVGGVLSTNDSGALRLRYGALRDLIIGVTLALPDGTLASSGGKVVKNVAGYDLPKLATGALGTLGVITRAIFRLHPLCRDAMTLHFATQDLDVMQNAVLSVQDSQLAHTAFQIECSGVGDSTNRPTAHILFEATTVGLAAQKAKLREVLRCVELEQTEGGPWLAKQRLWDSDGANSVVAKLIVLPTHIASAIRELKRIVALRSVEWQFVVQATGIGWLRGSGALSMLKPTLQQFREYLQAEGGSLVVLRQPEGANRIETWGNPSDAIGVMRALKQQLDPKSTLNPGRFVGGI
jgi:glycolate oxidase FAD binding subunit